MSRSPESRWQLAFDFERKAPPPEETVYPMENGTLAPLDSREPELGRFVFRLQEKLVVRTPTDAGNYFMHQVFQPFDAFTQEELYALLLTTANQATHAAMIYRGTIDTVQVRMAEIFRPAILANSRSIILAHNHPSGRAEPSPEDLLMTRATHEAGRILGIEVLDHLVCGKGTFVSIKERNRGFE